MKWIIIYGDGSTFSNLDGVWEDAPGRDMQAGLFRDPKLGWTIRHGATKDGGPCDFYRLDDDGSIVGMDTVGMIDHVVYELMIAEPCTDLPTVIHCAVHVLGTVKQGKMLSSVKWKQVFDQAIRLRNKLRLSE